MADECPPGRALPALLDRPDDPLGDLPQSQELLGSERIDREVQHLDGMARRGRHDLLEAGFGEGGEGGAAVGRVGQALQQAGQGAPGPLLLGREPARVLGVLTCASLPATPGQPSDPNQARHSSSSPGAVVISSRCPVSVRANVGE